MDIYTSQLLQMVNVKSQLLFTISIQFVNLYQQTSALRTECNTADLMGVDSQLPLHHVSTDLLCAHQSVHKQHLHFK
jgi:hypothetical protein